VSPERAPGRLAFALAGLLLAGAPLAARSDPQVDAACEALRTDGSLKVRTQAAIVLGQRGAPEAVPALRRAVAEDRAPAVRLAAVGALGKLGARAARSTLESARAADPDPAVQAAAARALAALGPVTLQLEPAEGTPAARPGLRDALARRLGELGFGPVEPGELKVRPVVEVEVSSDAGRTQIVAHGSLAVVDADGRVELLEATARATLQAGATGARLASTTSKVVEAAARGLADDLAARLGRR
jgi:HEAT repeats